MNPQCSWCQRAGWHVHIALLGRLNMPLQQCPARFSPLAVLALPLCFPVLMYAVMSQVSVHLLVRLCVWHMPCVFLMHLDVPHDGHVSVCTRLDASWDVKHKHSGLCMHGVQCSLNTWMCTQKVCSVSCLLSAFLGLELGSAPHYCCWGTPAGQGS